MNRLSDFSLKNRALIALVTIVVAVFGGISLSLLKLELIPSVSFPQLVVVTNYPGASPVIVEKEVSTPIENAIQAVPGLEATSSTSQAGISQVTAEFTYGTNIESAEQKIQLAINKLSNILPDSVEPQVFAGSFADAPIVQYAVTSDLTQAQLDQVLNDIAVKELGKIDGVREVSVFGANGQHIEVRPRQDVLDDKGLTIADISTAITANGLRLGAGTVDSENGELSIVSGTRLSSTNDIGAIPLPAGTKVNPRNGTVTITTIGEVADVLIVDNEVTSVSRVNGLPSLTLAVTKTADANTVDVSRDVRALVPELETLMGNNTVLNVVFDQAPFIEKSIESLTTEGLLGLGFAILIILVFLLSIRSTLVTAVSIPSSILLTFIGMWASEFSLNILTIGAVTISIGRVVDDSIVVVENIKRHIELGEEKLHAISTAVKEVATAVTSSTITTVAVFLPLAFVSGLSGELFRPFAVTVTIALLASLFVSLTIVPVLSYWFLGKSKRQRDLAKGKPATDTAEKFDVIQRGYRPVVAWTIRRPLVTVLVAVLTLVGTLALTPFMKTNFVGGSGQTTITLRHAVPAGETLDSKVVIAEDAEKDILAIDGIERVQTTVGGGNRLSALFGGSGDITYQVTISEEPGVDADAVQAEVTRQLESIPTSGTISIAGGGPAAFGSTSIDITIKAPSEETLNSVTDEIFAAMSDSGAADEVSSSLSDVEQFISINIDRAAAAREFLTEAGISRTLSSIINPNSITQIVIDDVTMSVIVMPPSAPTTVDQLRAFELTSPTGEAIALSSVATITIEETAASRTTERGVLSSTVAVTPSTDDLTAANATVTAALEAVDLPSGVTATIGGVSQEQADAFQQLGLALLAAILIVYVVMVATFRSLRQPLLLLVSIPFAATGAIGLQILSGIPLGVSSLIGLLMLVGIVVTNAIVLIDLVNQYRDRGSKVPEALLEGTTRRVRPVLMTALATVFALTPLAIGITGSGGFISQPLAIVVIGGLLSSTVLTLLVLPALYSLVEGAKERREIKKAPVVEKKPRARRTPKATA
ncbi:MAG: efflux RND transporter permease subunit [Microbacteriaceae bacterium]